MWPDLSSRILGAEVTHKLRLKIVSLSSAVGTAAGFGVRSLPEDWALRMQLWGQDFPNPIGIAAGFDKQAKYLTALLHCGYGSVEVGTVVPRPHHGNRQPRLFRYPKHRALVNNMGCNSAGHDRMAQRLKRWRVCDSRARRGIVGVNLGVQPRPQPASDAAIDDFTLGLQLFAPLADYLVLNLSCPNLPDELCYQHNELELERLLKAVRAIRAGYWQGGVPVLLKVGLDLTYEQCEMIARQALAAPVDGLVVANTMRAPAGWPAGGISGRPVRERAIRVLARFYALTGGRMPLVGVGGIESARDAYARVRAGASLLQIHTALAFDGFGLVDEINRDLTAALHADGYSKLSEVIGLDAEWWLGETNSLDQNLSEPKLLEPQISELNISELKSGKMVA